MMRTFEFDISTTLKVVVPEQFLKDMRWGATWESATPFLKKAQEDFPEDDDEFLLRVLSNGLRKGLQDYLGDLFTSSGMGCTIAPPTVGKRSRKPPENAEAVLATEVDRVLHLVPTELLG